MKTTLSFFVFLFSLSAFAETINGTVKDATGQPLAGATVAIENVRSVVTNDRGAFGFEVPAGSYTLRASHAGFQTGVRTAEGGRRVHDPPRPARAGSIDALGL